MDAQLPRRLVHLLNDLGHDAIHVSDLPDGSRTPDSEINRVADDQSRVVVSKDRDFRDGHLLRGSPQRLLLVSTGNISNNALLTLVEAHIEAIDVTLDRSAFVEMTRDSLIAHSDH